MMMGDLTVNTLVKQIWNSLNKSTCGARIVLVIASICSGLNRLQVLPIGITYMSRT